VRHPKNLQIQKKFKGAANFFLGVVASWLTACSGSVEALAHQSVTQIFGRDRQGDADVDWRNPGAAARSPQSRSQLRARPESPGGNYLRLARKAVSGRLVWTLCHWGALGEMTSHVNDPPYWRDRAEELRVLAERLKGADAKAMILGCARDYDLLAERAQERLKTD
jgi:hypothetical protein